MIVIFMYYIFQWLVNFILFVLCKDMEVLSVNCQSFYTNMLTSEFFILIYLLFYCSTLVSQDTVLDLNVSIIVTIYSWKKK